jgi:foldase protein PrsA
MPRLTVAASALGVCILAAAAFAGCGGAIPGDAVAQVGGTPITRATFEHWLSVAASASAQTAAGTGPAAPVPDPPAYSACIAHLQATAPKPAKGRPAPTGAQLKIQCEQEYTALKQQALGFLISASWVTGEAASQGIGLSDEEIEKSFTEIKQRQFPKEDMFKRFLASSGQTASDLRLRVKLNLLSQRLQQKVAKTPAVTQAQIQSYYNQNTSRFRVPGSNGKPASQQTLAQVRESIRQRLQAQAQQQALSAFVTGYRKRWEARTHCRPGYVVQECSEFKPPAAAGATTSSGAVPGP